MCKFLRLLLLFASYESHIDRENTYMKGMNMFRDEFFKNRRKRKNVFYLYIIQYFY